GGGDALDAIVEISLGTPGVAGLGLAGSRRRSVLTVVSAIVRLVRLVLRPRPPRPAEDLLRVARQRADAGSEPDEGGVGGG
ncbi:hypothetical protein THAOC_05676, partial [Thalassiosira oceanica]